MTNKVQKEYSIYVYQFQVGETFQWIAEFPDIPGIHGTGNTSLAAFRNAYDQLQFHMKALEQNNFDRPDSFDYAIVRIDKKKKRK
jgi:predicted RNase H-like HicB family nuclease